jgi:hypothetical protein
MIKYEQVFNGMLSWVQEQNLMQELRKELRARLISNLREARTFLHCLDESTSTTVGQESSNHIHAAHDDSKETIKGSDDLQSKVSNNVRRLDRF